MTYSNLRFELAEGVARITIDRPAQFNALNLAVMEELLDVANRCSTDPAVRCVLLTGAGDRAFCAGGDVAGFAAAMASGEMGLLIQRMTTALHAAISRFARMDAPLLAAVNGVAAGAGLSLAAACDLVIAADTARFTSAYTRIGLTPDGSSTTFLTRLIGPRRAMELHMTDRVLTAEEALDWGLVNRVVPAAALMAEAGALAATLAAGPTRAYGGVKRLIQTGLTETLETQMERESRSILAMSRSADGIEGVTAFVAKRKPRFTGA
ncbi:MAG: enoyl-CoA hydratase/isomerase family protein [Acetobacteraceae bacterium]|nr:enoyl-CoA hydratase/isomerase family protein [Acetobacteraceae bacterium]